MPREKRDTSQGFSPHLPLRQDIVAPAVDCVRLDGVLDGRLLSPKIHRILLGMARLRNAVSSFRLEGEVVQLDRARRVLDGSDPAGPSELGVLKLARAYAELSRNSTPVPTVAGMREIHRALFTGVIQKDLVGKFKIAQNRIADPISGRTIFVPTPPERTEQELESLLDWHKARRWEIPPPVVAGLFFAEFQAIHPFGDGNGRMGRYLNVLLLKDLGLKHAPLLPFDTRLFRTSDNYYDKLETTNSGSDYSLWVRYFVHELRNAYRLANGRADLRPLLDRFTRRSTQTILGWILEGDGNWFSAGEFPNRRRYSHPAIWSSLADLKRAGLLESKGERKGRRYRLSSRFLASIYGRQL